MANHKQALKRMRQNKVRNLRNRQRRSMLKTALRKAHEALDTNAGTGKDMIQNALSQIARAKAKGLIHANNAARKASQIMRAFNKAQG